MKKTILIIDDDEDVHNVLGDYLQRNGYRTLHVESGEDGIRIASESLPDLVILDLLLHGQDGYETLIQLREIFPDLPVIVLTGLGGDEELNADVASLGAAACLRKTVPFEDILGCVSGLLKRANSEEKDC